MVFLISRICTLSRSIHKLLSVLKCIANSQVVDVQNPEVQCNMTRIKAPDAKGIGKVHTSYFRFLFFLG